MSLQHTAVQRSLEHLGFGIQVLSQKKQQALNAYVTTETFQEYQIELDATVNSVGTFAETKVVFDEPFYDCLGQRNADLDEPHFTYGLVLDPGSPDVFISAFVADWDTDEQGNFTAATVRVGLYSPTAVGGHLTGRVHVTFQGFSAPSDNPPEDTGQTY